MQLTMVNAVARDCCGAFCATRVETLSKSENGVITPLAGPVEIEVKALNNTTLPATDREALVAFQGEVADLARVVQG
ncbi:MAG: hypothetical protein KDC57_11410, partial [Saprospiraceae bacterium]|nr:hypothetical protein [Saprospiraceae bacterium]